MLHIFTIFVLTVPNAAALFHLLTHWAAAKGKITKLLMLFIPLIGAALYFFLLERPPVLPEDELSPKRGALYGSFGRNWDNRKRSLNEKIAHVAKIVARGPLIPSGKWDETQARNKKPEDVE